jgi:hypothetical protein
VTSSLRAIRTEVKDQLKLAGLPNVKAAWPDKYANTKTVIVDADDPYLDFIEDASFYEAGREFNALATVRLRVTVLVGNGDTEALRNTLDDLLVQVLAAVGALERNWTIEPIGGPFYEGTYGPNPPLAIRVSMRTQLDLEEV